MMDITYRSQRVVCEKTEKRAKKKKLGEGEEKKTFERRAKAYSRVT